jgi:hypothetical protein
MIMPGRVISSSTVIGACRAAGLVPVVVVGLLEVVLGHTIAECMTLARVVVGILVLGTLAVKEPIQVLLVEGGPLSGSCQIRVHGTVHVAYFS